MLIHSIQFPFFQNDNLYVSTVNFRMQESECFDELKAPPSEGGLVVNLPPNGVCRFGNGTCPTSDYSEDPCTPGLPSSENFPLLSGHMMEGDGARESQDANKMLTVDCGEGKALLDHHPYQDVGYNQTGSPLSVASGGSYWTTGGDENESVSYHRMSPKGLALCEQEGDDQYPSPPDSPSAHASYSMMGSEIAQKSAPSTKTNQNTSSTTSTSDLPKSPTSLASPTSPTSPVALYSMQASASPSASAAPDAVRREEHASISSDEEGGDISSYVQQTTASSLGLLVPVPQSAQNIKGKEEAAKEEEKREQPPKHEEKHDDGDADSVDSDEDADDALESYVRTGTDKAPHSPLQSPEATGATSNPVENYVKAGNDTSRDLDMRVIVPRVRSASGGALDSLRRTHAPDFMDDSDSAISMEDADLQYVQAGAIDEFDPVNAGDPTPPTTPKTSSFSQNVVPASPVLPGVAIDFPSDGSDDDTPLRSGSSLVPGGQNNSNSPNLDDRRLSDNDLSDVDYDRYNDDAIDGYVTHGRAHDKDDDESCPMLPYVAIDLAQVPSKSTNSPTGVTVDKPQEEHGSFLGNAQPVGMDSGYVPQNQAHIMGTTKEGGSAPTSPTEKSAYDNPEYGVLAQCLSEIEQNRKRQENSPLDDAKRVDDDGVSLENDALIMTSSNENLTDSPTNNNSPYVPHGKAPLRQNIERLETPSGVDQGYLPHGNMPSSPPPGQALPQNTTEGSEVNLSCAQGLAVPGGTGDRGYIPINNIPAV